MLEFNVTVSFPAAPLLTVILALVGEYQTQFFPAVFADLVDKGSTGAVLKS